MAESKKMNDESRFKSRPEYDNWNTAKTSEDIHSSALQNSTPSLPTGVQETGDCDSNSENELTYWPLSPPSDDLPIDFVASYGKQFLNSFSIIKVESCDSALDDDLMVLSNNYSSSVEARLFSKNIISQGFPSEETDELHVSQGRLITKHGKEVQGSAELDSVTASHPSAAETTHRLMRPPSMGLILQMLSAITKYMYMCPGVFFLVIHLLMVKSTLCEVIDVPLLAGSSKVHLTSPNYPFLYPNDAFIRWHITAPCRILVEFNDFNVEEKYDFLEVLDIVDIRNTERYTGERLRIPSFLTQGNRLNATFASFGTGVRKGFNLTLSCYEKTDMSRGRLIDGNTPAEGFLELLSQSGQWVGVCEDNLSFTVAKVICGELGYPGVKEISYKTGGCHSDVNDQTCIKAPSCEDDTHLLRDCPFTTGNCRTTSSVKLKCNEPGFKGCYKFAVDQLQNGLHCNSDVNCVSSCRGKTSHAVFVKDECFCLTDSQVKLPGRQLAENQISCINLVKNNDRIVSAWVYNASVGFCNQTVDVMNGTWNSNSTWFGSIVHLTCDDGYSLNGSGALQCVPGVSPYYPVWNGSIPTCVSPEDFIHTSTDESPGTTPDADDDGGIQWKTSLLQVLLPTCIIAILVIAVVIVFLALKFCKRNRMMLRMLATHRHHSGPRNSTGLH